MSASDRPGSTPGLPRIIPPWVGRLQVQYLNPVIRRAAPYLPGFAIVHHRGRKSGKSYSTVVNAFRKGDVLTIGLGHGKTDWVKNVLAAGTADVHLFRRDIHITNPRLLPAGTADEQLPLIARLAGRQVGLFVADIA